MEQLLSHKEKAARVLDKKKRLNLTKEFDVKEGDINDFAVYDNDYFNDRYWKFIKKTKDRTGRRMEKDSVLYNNIKIVILHAYMKVFLRIVIDTILKGEKIVFFKQVITMHLTGLPSFRKYSNKIKYKYIHQWNGVYPVLRVAISPLVVYPLSIKRRIHNKAMRIDAFYKLKMSRMISYKMEEDNLKLSGEWNTIIDTKLLKN